eukprot:scaffold6403_cov128-Skeletonema_dohrnii-CCMP3373.AAC.15
MDPPAVDKYLSSSTSTSRLWRSSKNAPVTGTVKGERQRLNYHCSQNGQNKTFRHRLCVILSVLAPFVCFQFYFLYNYKLTNGKDATERIAYQLGTRGNVTPPAPVLCANGKKKKAVLIFIRMHMHMYSDLHQKPFSNSRNGEHNTTLDSPDDIRALLDKDKGDTPVMLTTSSQSMFEESDLSWLQQSDLPFFWGYHFETVKNQGNSLREAFPFLYEEIKHSNNPNDDTVYIFARSDTFLMSPVDIPCSFNLGPESAKVYATRIEGYKQAILARRRNIKLGFGLGPKKNSERMLRDWLLGNKLNVTEHEDIRAWALLRVRADQRIDHQDQFEFKIDGKTSLPQLAFQIGIGT